MNGGVGIVVGWMLGLFSVRLANDASAVVRCRRTLFELKELLESLARFAGTGRAQSEEQILEKLEQIKRIAQQLSVDHSEMLFPCILLIEKLQATFPLFPKYRLLDQNAAHKPHAIASSLCTITWGIDCAPPYEARIIPEIQRFLNLSQLQRFLAWARSKYKKFRIS